MPDEQFRRDLRDPEPWRSDLNPDALAGQNLGVLGPHPEDDARTSYGIKYMHRRLREFTNDELKSIPYYPRVAAWSRAPLPAFSD
jgi:hypothetical protein